MATAREKIIDAITAPLGFFVLALLIVESFLATVLIGAGLSEPNKMIGMWVGIVLFLIVLIDVSIFVWCKPQNLTYDKAAHLAQAEIDIRDNRVNQ